MRYSLWQVYFTPFCGDPKSVTNANRGSRAELFAIDKLDVLPDDLYTIVMAHADRTIRATHVIIEEVVCRGVVNIIKQNDNTIT